MTGGSQERIQREAQRLLKAGVTGQVFPGASVCVGFREGDEIRWVDAATGHLGPQLPAVEVATPYDLASLTKPLVAMTALRLAAHGKVSLSRPIQEILGEARPAPIADATLEQLLSHRAGLSAWGALYLDLPHDPGSPAARRWMVSEACRRPDEDRNAGGVYSDLGYIIAGVALERACGRSLQELVKRWVTEPMGIADDIYYAGALSAEERTRLAQLAPPTEHCEWRGRLIRGEVHDENCAALGGVAGHAGMFGTARAVATFGRFVLDALAGRNELFDAELLQHSVAPRDDGGSYRMGWDGRSGAESAAGKRMGETSFGHLGFTGTSIWCDRERDLVIVLLSNRVFPTRANTKIRGFRPAFHDGIVAAYDG